MKPPENVLFVCKLNPLTDEEDLQLIFSRFDPRAKAEIIRDQETGDSLQYAFVEFDTEKACNEAYFKMNNALVDDRRIKVDFSQSVAKEWSKYMQMKRRISTTHRHFRDSNQRHIDRSHLKRDTPRQVFNDNVYDREENIAHNSRNYLHITSSQRKRHEKYGCGNQGGRDKFPSDASSSDHEKRYDRSSRRKPVDTKCGERKQSYHHFQDRRIDKGREFSEGRKNERRRRCDSRDYDEKYHRRSSRRKTSRDGNRDRDEKYRRKSSKRKSSRDRDRKDEKYHRKSSKTNSSRNIDHEIDRGNVRGGKSSRK